MEEGVLRGKKEVVAWLAACEASITYLVRGPREKAAERGAKGDEPRSSHYCDQHALDPAQKGKDYTFHRPSLSCCLASLHNVPQHLQRRVRGRESGRKRWYRHKWVGIGKGREGCGTSIAMAAHMKLSITDITDVETCEPLPALASTRSSIAAPANPIDVFLSLITAL